LNYFYTNPQLFENDPAAAKSAGKSSRIDKQKLNKLFDRFADEKNRDRMEGEPLGKFFREIGVDPEKDGGTTLAFAYAINCKTLGVIKRDEFVEGLAKLGKEEVKDIKAEATTLRGRLSDRTWFRDFYKWLFNFAKDDPERKSIDMEPAVELLNTVLPPHFPLCDRFVEFLRNSKQKTFSQDNWDMTLEFAKDVKQDLTNYDDVGGAFPPIFDEFVQWLQRQRAAAARGGGGGAGGAAAAKGRT